MIQTARTIDKLAENTSEDTTGLLGVLNNDPDRVTEFRKQLEDFIVDNDEDSIGNVSQIIPDSRPYDKNRYDSILLNSRSSRAICLVFDAEPCGLIQSDAAESDFSMKSILERMTTGHKVYKYNYNTASRKIVTIKIFNGIVQIYTSEATKNRIGFSDVYGIVLGASSSTFKLYKSKIDFRYGSLHSPEDCFSIINEFRSFDFATSSSLARYDICLSLSWLCSMNNSLQSNIPFTKSFLSIKNIKDKLRREAKIRFISVVELFILAIYKTIKQQENLNGVNRMILLLNKRFTFSGKLYRFIRFVVMPMILSDGYTRRSVKDKIRLNLLVSNKLVLLKTIINRREIISDKLEAKTKKTVLESMIVSSCKSIFRQKESRDPFLALLTRKNKK